MKSRLSWCACIVVAAAEERWGERFVGQRSLGERASGSCGAGIVWREASMLPPAPYDALGPKAFPIWVSYALGALGLAMLVRLVLGLSLGRAGQAVDFQAGATAK